MTLKPQNGRITEVELDFFELLKLMDAEIKRAGLCTKQARAICLERYGKRTRHALTDEQLIDFWRYLEGLPTAKKMTKFQLDGLRPRLSLKPRGGSFR